MERDHSFTFLVLLAGLCAAAFLFYQNNYMERYGGVLRQSPNVG